jgi:RimJ/RimL family protein N-acetyltransferase
MSAVAKLSPEEALALADSLPDAPRNAIPIGALRSGAASAYRLGGSFLTVLSGEGMGFGDPPKILVMLRAIEDCTCVMLPPEDVPTLCSHLSNAPTLVDDVQYVLDRNEPLAPDLTAQVKRVLPQDLVEATRRELFSEWPMSVLERGIIACAFIDGVPVAQGSSLFRSATHADVGVKTLEGFRNRGLATTCARSVITQLLAESTIPVWSTSTENIASNRVAAKLGFKRLDAWRFVVPPNASWD